MQSAVSSRPGFAEAPNHGLCTARSNFTLVVHGGAQTSDSPRQREADWLTALLAEARAHLAAGATGLDTIVWAIGRMEQSGLFNAGNGAIANIDGIRELDAAIMDGKTRRAGAVGSVVGVPSPIAAARWVMDKTDMVMLVGPSAERALGFPEAPRARATAASAGNAPGEHPWGTVGIVVLDRCGDLAAGTSTGGWGHKVPGRIGDSPVIGAGTYANNQTVAVSGTGHGEIFMRNVAAFDVHARMAYQGLSVSEAANRVIQDVVALGDGEGGLIAVDRDGHYAWPFHAAGMLRGVVTERDAPIVAVK